MTSAYLFTNNKKYTFGLTIMTINWTLLIQYIQEFGKKLL